MDLSSHPQRPSEAGALKRSPPTGQYFIIADLLNDRGVRVDQVFVRSISADWETVLLILGEAPEGHRWSARRYDQKWWERMKDNSQKTERRSK